MNMDCMSSNSIALRRKMARVLPRQLHSLVSTLSIWVPSSLSPPTKTPTVRSSHSSGTTSSRLARRERCAMPSDRVSSTIVVRAAWSGCPMSRWQILRNIDGSHPTGPAAKV